MRGQLMKGKRGKIRPQNKEKEDARADNEGKKARKRPQKKEKENEKADNERKKGK